MSPCPFAPPEPSKRSSKSPASCSRLRLKVLSFAQRCEHTPGAYLRPPDSHPNERNSFINRRVLGLGYVPGVCWKILRSLAILLVTLLGRWKRDPFQRLSELSDLQRSGIQKVTAAESPGIHLFIISKNNKLYGTHAKSEVWGTFCP